MIDFKQLRAAPVRGGRECARRGGGRAQPGPQATRAGKEEIVQ